MRERKRGRGASYLLVCFHVNILIELNETILEGLKEETLSEVSLIYMLNSLFSHTDTHMHSHTQTPERQILLLTSEKKTVRCTVEFDYAYVFVRYKDGIQNSPKTQPVIWLLLVWEEEH